MKDLYYTHSLNIAAYLVYKGFNIQGKVKSNTSTSFYFQRSKELDQAVIDYNNDIELKKFITAFKTVKDYMRN